MAGCHSCASDNSTEAERNNPLFRHIIWIALLSNATMIFIEIAASYASGSISLQADALDFFGDAVNYGITLFVIAMALHTRAKAALFKSATMAAFGLWVISSAIYRAYTDSTPYPIMGTIGMSALAMNVVVAVLLFRYRSDDSNMRSIWLCSRNDAFGNIAVMCAAGGVLATNIDWPDLIVAGLIAGLNLSAAIQVMRQALTELRTEQ
ncbi:cation transporter [Amphritea sp. 1_MG-2023]|uniref:cation transporter n=1 Tax=Amphritea sp. 1_MG-2023 TaxID=3062670 RepID=UPI0026E20373|nr:cation transporter [Amphritea sp. 1_MG-2023]MDO6565400.1 cation transporter [Amphritea sp. 1_MG-2023]